MTLPYVLFVEPQEQVLRHLPSAVNKLDAEWQSLSVKTPEAVLDIIFQRPVSVIVANFGSEFDYGRELFKTICSQTGFTIPFLILLEKSNEKRSECLDFVHLCLSAQCEPIEIVKGIQRGLAVWEQTKSNSSLAKLLLKLNKLPTPPALYFDLRDELESSNYSIESLANIVSRDQAIIVRLLNVVNSGFYAVPRSVVELKQAISLLGTELVLSLVLTAYLFDSLPLPGVNLDTLWKHNLTISALAKHIAMELGGDREIIDITGISGLLHDLGSLVLLANLPTQYHKIIRQAAGDEKVLLSLEYQHFGVAHPEIGALALKLCNLSDKIIDAVALHHKINNQHNQIPVKALSITEWLVNSYTLHGGEFSDSVDCEGMEDVQQYIESWWNKCTQIAERIQSLE